MSAPDFDTDLSVLDAATAFARWHPATSMALFASELGHAERNWQPVAPRSLPAAKTFAGVGHLASQETEALWRIFAETHATRKWEQGYRRCDNLVGDDMIEGYGFTEIIGKFGPFVSDKMRCGIGVWGAHIDYPPHRHVPEEIYVAIAGSARFSLGHGAATTYELATPNHAVFVPSMLTHGFRTEDQPFAVFYIWRAGDMRELSSFD